MIGYAWDSLVYRVIPPGAETVIAGTVSPRGIEPVSGVTEAVDIRRTIGDNVLRVYQITVGTQDSQTAAKTRIYEGGYQDGALAAELEREGMVLGKSVSLTNDSWKAAAGQLISALGIQPREAAESLLLSLGRFNVWRKTS